MQSLRCLAVDRYVRRLCDEFGLEVAGLGLQADGLRARFRQICGIPRLETIPVRCRGRGQSQREATFDALPVRCGSIFALDLVEEDPARLNVCAPVLSEERATRRGSDSSRSIVSG